MTDLLTSQFLAALLTHASTQAHFARICHGGTMGILNATLIKQLPVILPPLDLQGIFAKQASAVERSEIAQQAALVKLEALFASLQHRAFRGEL